MCVLRTPPGRVMLWSAVVGRGCCIVMMTHTQGGSPEAQMLPITLLETFLLETKCSKSGRFECSVVIRGPVVAETQGRNFS